MASRELWSFEPYLGDTLVPFPYTNNRAQKNTGSATAVTGPRW